MTSPVPTHATPQPDPTIGPPSPRRGLVLLAVHLFLFTLFVLANIFLPQLMTQSDIPLTAERALTLKGMNLAVLVALALLFAALAFVLLHMRLPRQRPA